MKHKILRNSIISLIAIIALAAAGCASSAKWTRDDFQKYAQSKSGTRTFPLKCFATELNLKVGIVCVDYLDSRNSIDVFPAREMKEYMEKKYGVKIDITEFEALRKKGDLKVMVSADEKGNKQALLYSDRMALDGTSVSGGPYLIMALAGTSWLAVNWSEYREKVGTMDFRYKVEMGKSDQMQVFIVLAPLGSYISVSLKVRDGEPNEKGYYKLKTVVDEEIKVNYTVKGCNTAGLAENLKQLPALLRARDAKAAAAVSVSE
ncbi:MAG: hypothetical protein CVV44_23395 [Spirochaetae bacterium HGW-Spirochaetae-1]|jgi:hypothetical protein|nr:MAG: hypothetical protein CVV44_23395 [Spirochaetae bacterium HGW-Spirochaetae-1]